MDTTPLGASLAERIQGGDVSAEEELGRLYGRGLVAIARMRTGDAEAARDLSQQILIEALKALRGGELREPDKLAAFIQGIARNLINNFLRTRVRRAECPLDAVELNTGDPIQEQELAERQRLVQAEISSFSAIDQQILFWSLVDGRPLAEIATNLNISHDAVRTRKSRAIRKLKSRFASVSHVER
jgi:RNA polymerase sigma-70 factor (ECF subfamily)